MTRHDIHVCIASGQPLPNLLPALDPATRPQEAVLLVSADMRDKARLLRANFETLGCRVSEVAVPAYRIEEIRATVLDLLARHDGRSIALNATGGTKLMSLGAYEVFRELGHPAFYIDTDNRQHITLLPTTATAPLADLATVKVSLAAYGYAIEQTGSCQVAPDRGQLGEFLVKNVDRLAGALGVLNACAAKAKGQLLGRLEPQHLNNPAVQDLLAQCKTAGLLDVDGERLIFADESARFFANGGWLEEYVVKVVNRLKGQKLIRDHACNLKVESQRRVRNEIDVAFTAGNRLHLIECKTAQMIDRKDKEGRADGVAYKLEALRDLIGGTYARAMLVSYRQLTNEDRERCGEYKIEVVEGARIGGLYGILQRWIG